MTQEKSVALSILGLSLMVACTSSDKSNLAEAVTDARVAQMVTSDVTMLISDSGVIKYHAITPTWLKYDGTAEDEPYQYFPDGIEFQQIDSLKNVQERIVADTAYNWENRQIWHLINNVRVTSVKGELFETNDLYWDMRKHTVYSDSFIHIERMDNIIEGYGFTSTDNFSQYEIRQTSGIFPVKDEPAPVFSPTDNEPSSKSE